MLSRADHHFRAPSRSWPHLPTVLAVLCALLSSSDSARADLHGRIRGTIRDLNGKPIPGLMVRLTSPQLSVVTVTDTDGKGVYGFDNLAAGSYDLEVSGSGFQHQIKKGIVVQPPFRNIVDFALPAGPISPPTPPTPVIYQPPSAEVVLREVTGSITDKDHRPVPDALISLVNPATGASFRGRSSRDGKTKIESVPVGVYRAMITSPGYVTIELSRVEVSADAGLVLNLALVEYPLHFDGRPEDFIPPEQAVPPSYRPPGT